MGKTLIVSAINIVDGGALTVLKDALCAFNKIEKGTVRIIFLVSNQDVICEQDYKNLDFFYFPKSKTSWIYRIFYEYFYFYFLSRNLKADSWLSLHDISPNVDVKKRYVYCHNPSVFLDFPFSDFSLDPKQFLFSRLYKYLYRFNIGKNRKVFVQQGWMADEFVKIFNLNNLMIAEPDIKAAPLVHEDKEQTKSNANLELFYPAFPRYFKNHKLLLSASRHLPEVKFLLSITGDENPYIRSVVGDEVFGNCSFLGRLDIFEVYKYYQQCDALVFPSLLETWGLPLTEVKMFKKPIIAADLAYAHETVGDYPFVYWFDPLSVESFVCAVKRFQSKGGFDSPKVKSFPYSKLVGWDSFANYLLSEM
ncbi:glycosyltransferase [Pseudomonas sp.]|uniref:glycosyltransferase n=1 Tax=Pseudomonas sp. TaxID=306 RepID=UPI002B650086|nr:glycosyltransferase [Pseudomonas sp.]HUE91176.1 glycosyltransferase [Pseudomonas sp.]